MIGSNRSTIGNRGNSARQCRVNGRSERAREAAARHRRSGQRNQRRPFDSFRLSVSSDLQDRISLRPLIEVAAENGLRLRSQIMTDKLVALRPTASGGLLAASTRKRLNNWTARFWCCWGCPANQAAPTAIGNESHSRPRLAARLRIGHHPLAQEHKIRKR